MKRTLPLFAPVPSDSIAGPKRKEPGRSPYLPLGSFYLFTFIASRLPYF
nr:MAG TPA: hypothetical protein [Caudoviricetes sp.]